VGVESPRRRAATPPVAAYGLGMTTNIAESPVRSLEPAGAAQLLGVLPRLRPPLTTYLAACGWPLPADPAAAAASLLDERRVPFVSDHEERPLVGVLERHPLAPQGTLLVLGSPDAEADRIAALLDRLLRVAFHELGLRRCEWRFLAGWERFREAATRAGFQPEASLGEACFFQGRYDDLVIAGLLAAEWRGRR
jgi:hypothetical protein